MTEFHTGHGVATASATPISLAPSRIYGFVLIRADAANASALAIGGPGVTLSTGFLLPAGAELTIPIDRIDTIYIVGDGLGFSWLAT